MKKKKTVVISIHGIRTDGKWQEKLGNLLNDEDFVHIPFQFGYYDLFHFLNPISNEKMIERFYSFYCTIINKTEKRPSVIAHSFGTFILAHCLTKRQDLKFDKLIFCGSIISKNFDWSTLLARNQVNQVRNEYSRLDLWARIAKYFVKKAGDSGFSGYSYRRPNFFEKRFDYKHSDYFSGNHMKEYWIPFLKEKAPIFNVKCGSELLLDEYFQTLNDCREIDIECYKEVVDNLLPEGLSKRWISVNDDIYTFVYEERAKKLKGYINALPVVDLTFEKILKGQVLDDEITENDIAPYLKAKELKIYFMSIATKQEVRIYRGGLINTVADRLFAGFFKKLIDYYERDKIIITEFATIPWTFQGRKLCELIGMTQVGKDKYNHPIFFIKTTDLTKSKIFIQGIENLLKAYGIVN